MSPTAGGGIALAMLPTILNVGDTVEVEIRNALHAAKIVKPPFVPNRHKSD